MEDFGPEGFGLGVEESEGDWKAKAARAGAAGIEQKDPLAVLDGGFVRMTADHDGDLSDDRIQIEVLEGVDEIHETIVEFDGFGGGQSGAGSLGVDVAADSGEGREIAEGCKDGRIAYIAGVQDVVNACQSGQSFGTQQAVGVGDDADEHGGCRNGRRFARLSDVDGSGTPWWRE